jgi:beta-glucosidase
MQAAIDRAEQSDAAIVVARTYESEEFDRPNINLPKQQGQLIRLVAEANPHTIVIVMNGGPVETESWEGKVPAIIEAWYAGQEQGNAIARILFGDVNPCGKLPISFPRSLDQTPVSSSAQYPGIDGVVNYSEGQFVGYRGYDFYDIDPMYPFGFGLSYTTFEYGGLEINPSVIQHDQPIDVSFNVTNSGNRQGTEIAQLYLAFPSSVQAPPKQLVGWAKVRLQPGESQRVQVILDPLSPEHLLSYWDVAAQSWSIASGEYRLFVGSSSRDIRCQGAFHIDL